MPHLHLHPRQSRRATTFMAAAAVAVAILAVTACTSSTPPAPKAPTAAVAVAVSGAGSTFDAPFFTSAFAAYQQAHPGIAVSYAALGSSDGITRFAAGQVGFGATDVPASPADLARASGTTVQVPVELGAVVVAYNVITNGSGPLRLTGRVIARIFLGQVTKWDDPAIQALNPATELPDAYITVVHRSDGSGTTYIFSNYLSSVSPAWATAVGTGRSLRWPAGIGADGNAGVAAQIGRIPYSIGYTERS
jgi:phosphate transport system substrate-binding protein